MHETIRLIGNTPLYHLDNTSIYIKLEQFNCGGSIKDRAVLSMVQGAMSRGEIKADTTLVEATSGNTGIALAMLGAIFQIPVIIIMPESMSIERRQLIKAYGATLILTKKEKGMQGAIDKMTELVKKHDNYLCLSQFDNPDNPHAHYVYTAKEILQELPDVDIFVAFVGTGGTFSGIAKRLKEHNPNILCFAGEPENSAVLSGDKPHNHSIEGIGANFVPNNFQRELADGIILVKEKDAFDEVKQFAKQTGILVGISSGANIVLAKRLAKQYPDKKIVTIAPDGLEKYMSRMDFD